MIRVTEEIAHKVWGYLEAGDDIETICSALASIEERTIERLRTVLNGFKSGKSNKELATPEWKENTIAERRRWWENYKRAKHGWSREIHLNSMAESAQKLRSRIVNPDLRRRPFTDGKSIWDWHDFNWRIHPNWWFGMVVPMLDEVFLRALIPNWENLLSHLKDSKFQKHYDELVESCAALQRKVNEFIVKSRSEDPQWGVEWNKFDDFLGICLLDSKDFQPDTIASKETIESIIDELPVSQQFIEDAVTRFRDYYPDLDKHCARLENLVQQVYDDLDADVISVDIEAGKCSACSSD